MKNNWRPLPLSTVLASCDHNPNASPDINAGNETTSCHTTLNFCAPPKDSPEMAWWRDSIKTLDARMAWWREGRFGMMISWGVWAHLGNRFHGVFGVKL
jgi:hypothetical protein